MGAKQNISSTILTILSLIASSTFAQKSVDVTDDQFRDNLLDHFVGKSTVSGAANGQEFKCLDLNAERILNHQYLRLHEKGRKIVPWLNAAYEAMYFIGYDHGNKRYIAQVK